MDISRLLPATVIAMPIPGTPFLHVLLIGDAVSEDGTPMVISNSQRSGGVTEEPLSNFGDVDAVRVLGYWSERSPADVLRRARRWLGTKWHLTRWNCEHFARAAHGLKLESPQLKVGSTLAAAIALVALVLIRRR